MDEKDFSFTAYLPRHKVISRILRKRMTPQEKHLWYDYLRTSPVKFYRQRSIAGYIADFYCSKLKLVIELDGSQHYTAEGKSYDELRTQIINTLGVRVLRFSNYDIDHHFSQVCKTIENEIRVQ